MNFFKSLWTSTPQAPASAQKPPQPAQPVKEKPSNELEESARAALASVTTKFENSKANLAVGAIRDSFKELGKELGDNFNTIKADIKEKLQGGKPASIDTAFECMGKYYLLTLNEASMALYLSQTVNRNMVKELFDAEVHIEQSEVNESLAKHLKIAKTMEKETKELGELKDEWAKNMGEKLSLLLK